MKREPRFGACCIATNPGYPEELELAMYFAAIDTLTGAGWEHYEVSNFAVPGAACRHNRAYWESQPWWGFGPGAASFVHGLRQLNHRSTKKYLERIEMGVSPVEQRETITHEQWTSERFVFGMRQMAGVHWEEWRATAIRPLSPVWANKWSKTSNGDGSSGTAVE